VFVIHQKNQFREYFEGKGRIPTNLRSPVIGQLE